MAMLVVHNPRRKLRVGSSVSGNPEALLNSGPGA